jgi:hypothetical protein
MLCFSVREIYLPMHRTVHGLPLPLPKVVGIAARVGVVVAAAEVDVDVLAIAERMNACMCVWMYVHRCMTVSIDLCILNIGKCLYSKWVWQIMCFQRRFVFLRKTASLKNRLKWVHFHRIWMR